MAKPQHTITISGLLFPNTVSRRSWTFCSSRSDRLVLNACLCFLSFSFIFYLSCPSSRSPTDHSWFNLDIPGNIRKLVVWSADLRFTTPTVQPKIQPLECIPIGRPSLPHFKLPARVAASIVAIWCPQTWSSGAALLGPIPSDPGSPWNVFGLGVSSSNSANISMWLGHFVPLCSPCWAWQSSSLDHLGSFQCISVRPTCSFHVPPFLRPSFFGSKPTVLPWSSQASWRAPASRGGSSATHWRWTAPWRPSSRGPWCVSPTTSPLWPAGASLCPSPWGDCCPWRSMRHDKWWKELFDIFGDFFLRS